MDTSATFDSPTGEGPLCADVAIDIPGASHGQSIYTYAIPRHLESLLQPGHLIWIPLRREAGIGVVERIHRDPPDVTLKSITALVKPEFRLSEIQFSIAHWIARETVSTRYAAASPFFPPGVQHRALPGYELIDAEDPRIADLSLTKRKIVELLRERGYLTAAQVTRALGKSHATALRALEEEGFIERSLEVVDRQPAVKTARFARLLQFDVDAVRRSERQRSILEVMAQRQRLLGGENDLFPVADLMRQAGASGSAMSALEKKGLIEIVELPATAGESAFDPVSAPVLSPAQATAWQQIETAIRERDSQPMLLYGVTGSGKTELYLRMVGRCLRENRGSIVLVPEIALATQIVRRFEERFPGRVAVLHSAQSDSERYTTWKSVESGEKQIVVGPRSALFAPIADLGCIAVDEEQDPAYKQDADPRYHARQLAEHMAAVRRAVLVFGSATPSIETAYRTTRDIVRRVDLPERIRFEAGGIDTILDRESAAMPEVTVVDMRAEARLTGATLISTPLQDTIRGALARQEQVIVLLNRRGTSTIVLCRSCGRSVDCPLCDIPMVYHRDQDRMICHRCNTRTPPARTCPACGGPLDYFGAGTQRIEQEVKRYFIGARVLRVDRDSIKQLGGYERVLKRVERGEVDIVVGTQLVAKGLDFPRVTAVGVIQADSLLHLPDYRSAERTYQLISQVAGRAGRRASQGQVIVQTYTPDHYAIVAAASHSYEDFYAEEIAFRQKFRYPPFSRLARFTYRAASEAQCRDESQKMALELVEHADERSARIDLLGPAPAFAAKVRGEFQWQIVLRSSVPTFDALLDGMPARPGWIVDVDPSTMI